MGISDGNGSKISSNTEKSRLEYRQQCIQIMAVANKIVDGILNAQLKDFVEIFQQKQPSVFYRPVFTEYPSNGTYSE